MGVNVDSSSGKVSVVILTWNRKDDLMETLAILENEIYSNLEVIVIDNASTDGTDGAVAKFCPSVIYKKLSDNLGIAGYNIGFKEASGDYIVALDSDSYPHPDAIRRMVKLFEENKRAGIVAFDVHTPTGKAVEIDIKDESIEEVYGYHGAGVGFRKEVFEKVGFWYEPFFLYFNEMDHAMRSVSKGYSILTSPSIISFHKSSKVSRPSKNAPYFYTRNAFWLIWRNYPLLDMFDATFEMVRLVVRETFMQKTAVYLKGFGDAFKAVFKVMSERSPMDETKFKKFKLPLPLIFSRFE